MRKALWASLLLLSILTPFYLMTGIIYEEGGDQLSLVIKPYPMIQTGFGGGEEGTWKRLHPNQPLPWWQTGRYKLISTETLASNWEIPLAIGHLITILGWPLLGTIFAWRLIRKWSTNRAAGAGPVISDVR